MRWATIIRTTSVLIIFFGMTMIFPLAVGLVYGDRSVPPILWSMLTTMACGLLFYLPYKGAKNELLTQREGMAIVTLCWSCAGVFGALPFYLYGEPFSFVNAVFESVSGFTTTGSSILTDIESLPKGLLFWRSFIQWLGGMGIIVLSLAVLPFVGIGGMQLYKAEVPSPVPDKLKPRIRETATILWKVYAILSAAQVLFLVSGGMSLFDAACHTFTTMPTGGYSTWNRSIAHFNSPYIDSVMILFMLLAGINFSLHYQLLRGSPLAFWKDSEFRFYIGLVILLILIVGFDIYGTVYESAKDALRYGAFQVTSILTTTGYATADYELWPAASQLILLICMFIGASAGSTGGGMKCLRIMLYFKFCYKELFSLIHPKAVKQIKIGGKRVSDEVTRSVLGFLGLYTGIFAACAVMLSFMGIDFITSIAAVAATLGNIGPGLGMVGPTDNFAHIPAMGKWLLTWCMLLGRLEIYTVIIFLVPEFWRK